MTEGHRRPLIGRPVGALRERRGAWTRLLRGIYSTEETQRARRAATAARSTDVDLTHTLTHSLLPTTAAAEAALLHQRDSLQRRSSEPCSQYTSSSSACCLSSAACTFTSSQTAARALCRTHRTLSVTRRSVSDNLTFTWVELTPEGLAQRLNVVRGQDLSSSVTCYVNVLSSKWMSCFFSAFDLCATCSKTLICG